MTLQQRVPVPWLRDIVFLVLGGAGFGYSVVTGAGWPPLLVSAALMAGPGVVQLWLAGHTPGGGLSSVPASPEPPPPSPSLPSAPSAGGER
ncbi:hypothetical protein [Micromonospora sp. RTGN7]|uniref:hypothetical protein n=1 Tax=Micromonospora sp. RTGN7 TaxID=3016526 RepID=UPI0029FEF6DA|nr:hypothetical protein [Micromonospora sp. RTGN7]